MLAREWVRRSTLYFNMWCDSQGAEDFVNPVEIPESEAFLDWVLALPVVPPAFAEVRVLREAVPRHRRKWPAAAASSADAL